MIGDSATGCYAARGGRRGLCCVRSPGEPRQSGHERGHAGKPPSVGRAVVRVVATWISIVPFFLGYVTVLFDGRRRGLPDLIAGTEVVYNTRR